MSAARKFLAVFLAVLMLPWGAYVAAAGARAEAAGDRAQVLAEPGAATRAAAGAKPGTVMGAAMGAEKAPAAKAAALKPPPKRTARTVSKRKNCRTALLPGAPCTSFLAPEAPPLPGQDGARRRSSAARGAPPSSGRTVSPSPEPPRAFL